ncbi:uncharacterized protein V1510DRAFT_407387 [Dipodascopsis tothii]|uniref:uncharacterized protein n=1 Tax=Dipodascopsis tothii TaxID=44089 RepID=UPI0034CEFF39
MPARSKPRFRVLPTQSYYRSHFGLAAEEIEDTDDNEFHRPPAHEEIDTVSDTTKQVDYIDDATQVPDLQKDREHIARYENECEVDINKHATTNGHPQSLKPNLPNRRMNRAVAHFKTGSQADIYSTTTSSSIAYPSANGLQSYNCKRRRLRANNFVLSPDCHMEPTTIKNEYSGRIIAQWVTKIQSDAVLNRTRCERQRESYSKQKKGLFSKGGSSFHQISIDTIAETCLLRRVNTQSDGITTCRIMPLSANQEENLVLLQNYERIPPLDTTLTTYKPTWSLDLPGIGILKFAITFDIQ